MRNTINRRRTLGLLGAAGVAALFRRIGESRAEAATTSCITTPAETEGPYFVEEMLNRSDIRVDPTDGSVRPGVPLTLEITVHEVTSTACGVLAGAPVEIWHCDALGSYSDEAVNGTQGRKYLRGFQIADDNGVVRFTTVYPGWYTGRAVHIHFKVRTYSGTKVYDEFTSQFYLDDSITDLVHAQSPYSQHGRRNTRNSNDGIFVSTTNSDRLMLSLTQTDQGYAGVIDVGVTLKTAAVSKPTINNNGVVNAASLESGLAPGALITIFGQNLAAAARAVATSDLVDGNLPTILGGVSVQIDNQPAFLSYISPTQINAQAPSDSNIGTAQVTVTNSGGTSDGVSTTLRSIMAALFGSQSYVARPGDMVTLYGTGFGSTEPAIAAGAIVQDPVPLADPVTVSIGGAAAAISFAGLSAAGLYRFDVTVPALADGDYDVIAETSGVRSQSGVLVKIQS